MLSMTGYGRGRASLGGGVVVVELRAVNHRFVDLRVRMAPELAAEHDRDVGAQPFHDAKLLLLGNGRAGKTQLGHGVLRGIQDAGLAVLFRWLRHLTKRSF